MDEKTVLIKGFNAGYWLEKYEPELSKTIQESFGDQTHPYAEGFIKGSKEYVQEQIMSPSQETAQQELELDRDELDKSKEVDQSMSGRDLKK